MSRSRADWERPPLEVTDPSAAREGPRMLATSTG